VRRKLIVTRGVVVEVIEPVLKVVSVSVWTS